MKNATLKEALCEKAETLAGESNLGAARETISQLQAEWRMVGPTRRTRTEALWQRFRTACDRVYTCAQESSDAEFADKIRARASVCERLEALGSQTSQTPQTGDTGTDPPADDVAETVAAARAEWRQLPPVPRSQERSLTARFQSALTGVVEAYPAAFSGSDLDPERNRVALERLCGRVEALLEDTTTPSAAGGSPAEILAARLRDALASNTMGAREDPVAKRRAEDDEVKRAQTERRALGVVPGEIGRELSERFRVACDRFFEQHPPPPGRPRAPVSQRRCTPTPTQATPRFAPAGLATAAPRMQDFHPLIAEWFRGRFARPTACQLEAWPRIRAGRDVLVSAPTGSGKTLAAFLICLDRLVVVGMDGRLDDRIDVVYVSPLKALSNDIGKNLETPLAEIEALAADRGLPAPGIRTAVRTGDTPAWERERMVRRSPHILVTTPESLFILLTAARSRTALCRARTVIVDEIHALVDDKRGSHLALTLARLDDLVMKAGGARLQRVGLSATVRPIEDVARFLHGSDLEELQPAARSLKSAGHRAEPDVSVIDAGHRRQLDLAVEVPRDELGVVATNEMWAEMYERLAELILAHRTTLVFVNTRRLCERVAHHLAQRLGDEAVLAHHGSLSRRLRQTAESRLRAGRLRAVVATASLELGIDIGTVDLVCQIGSPRSIAVTLQRVGRSGPSGRHARRPPCAQRTDIRDDTRRADRVCRAGARHSPRAPRSAGDPRLAGRCAGAAAGGGLRV